MQWSQAWSPRVRKPVSSLQCPQHWRFSVYEGLICSNLDIQGRKEAGTWRTGRGRGAFLFLWRKVEGALNRGWEPSSLAATYTTQGTWAFRDHSLWTLKCEEDSQALHCHSKATWSLPPQRPQQVNTCSPRPCSAAEGEQVLGRRADQAAQTAEFLWKLQVAILSPQPARWAEDPKVKTGLGSCRGLLGSSEATGKTRGVFSLASTRSVQSCGKQHRLSEGRNPTRDDAGPRAERGQRVCKAVFEQSLKTVQVTGENRSPKEAWLLGLQKIFIFFLSFLIFLNNFLQWRSIWRCSGSHIFRKEDSRLFQVFKNLWLLKFKIIQIPSIHKLKTERERDEVWLSLYPKFLEQGQI